MRILVENGCYHLRNMGDVAMLQVAVRRLGDLWPDARIEVVTREPDLLARYCPTAHPVAAEGRRIWFKDRIVFGGLYRFLPGAVSHRFSNLEHGVRRRWPSLAHTLIQLRTKHRRVDIGDMDAFLGAVLGANLIVLSGGGDFTDAFIGYATTALDVFDMAIRRGIPTAMFGQGIGPIRDPALRARLKAVLPLVDLIAIRESQIGLPLLDSLSILSDRVILTGDDAIEVAYRVRAPELGAGIGVNLRVAAYSEVDSNLIEVVGDALSDAGQKYDAPLVPLPILFHDSASDVTTIRQLLAGHNDASDGGQSLDSPLKIAQQVRQCRVVVTGSYHPAVFALAQGIPAIGLARSAYYNSKFLGLADQFGVGCQVVFLDDRRLQHKLSNAIDTAWSMAEQVRPRLLEAAARQIEMGRLAYRRIYELVESRRGLGMSPRRPL